MTDSSSSWWKLTFLKDSKRSKSKVLYEIPAEFVSNATTSQHSSGSASGAAAHAEVKVHDSQLDARLEKIVDKTASKGRHFKVSHSGRFKEKKKVRHSLAGNPDVFASNDAARDENQRAKK